MTEARVLWFYVLQLLLPLPDSFALHHDDYQISRGLLLPASTLFSIAGWIALPALAIYRREQSPMLAFGLLWFLAGHALESTVLPLEFVYEHRNYLPSFGILICFSVFLFSPSWQERSNTLRFALAIGFVIFCALITGLRAQQWGDELRRTSIEAAVHPGSARANYEAAQRLIDKTFLSANGGNTAAYQAIQNHLQRASTLNRNNTAPLIGLLYLDCLAGYPKNLALQAQLHERFATQIFSPGDSLLIQSLSELLVNNRLCLNDDEVNALLKASLANPMADGAMRGMIYAVAMDYAAAKIGSLPLALKYARAAVQSNPDNVPLRVNFVQLLIRSGDKAAVHQEFSKLTALRIPPLDRATVDQLGKQLDRLEHDASPR
jgi:hypothetical protein